MESSSGFYNIFPTVRTSRLGWAQSRPGPWMGHGWAMPARLQRACHSAHGCSHWNNPTSWDVGGPRLHATFARHERQAGSVHAMRSRCAGRAWALPWSILTHFPQININLYGNELRRRGPGVNFSLFQNLYLGAAQARPTFSAV